MGAKKDKQKKRKNAESEETPSKQPEPATEPQQQHPSASTASAAKKQRRKGLEDEQRQLQQQQQLLQDAARKEGQGSEDEQQPSEQQQAGRRFTVSMAVPGSIIDNTQSFEMATFVAGQVRMLKCYHIHVACLCDCKRFMGWLFFSPGGFVLSSATKGRQGSLASTLRAQFQLPEHSKAPVRLLGRGGFK